MAATHWKRALIAGELDENAKSNLALLHPAPEEQPHVSLTAKHTSHTGTAATQRHTAVTKRTGVE
jgi:hypothetical protein